MSESRKITDYSTESDDEAIKLTLMGLPKELIVYIFSLLSSESITVLTSVSKDLHSFMHEEILPSTHCKSLFFSSWLDSEFKAMWAAADKLKEKYTPVGAKERSKNSTLVYGPGGIFSLLYSVIAVILFDLEKNNELQNENSFLRQQQLKALYREDKQNHQNKLLADLFLIFVFYLAITAVIFYQPVLRRLFFENIEQRRASIETSLLTDIVNFDRRFSKILGENGAWMLALPPRMTVQKFFNRLTFSILKAEKRAIELKEELKSVCSLTRKNLDLEDMKVTMQPYASRTIIFWQKKSMIAKKKPLLLGSEILLELPIKEKAVKRF